MKKLSLVIPKGRIFAAVTRLLEDAGIGIESNDRVYVPHIGDPELEAKIMKPQNIAQLIELGSHDIGFTGFDWIKETGARVIELMDLGLDPVKIVSAIPEHIEAATLRNRKIVVASEYEKISHDYLKGAGFDYLLIRTFGATEAFPPDDADMIIDNSSSGQTLRDHGLKILDVLMDSSTRFIVNPMSLEEAWKKEKIEEIVMLFEAVLNARTRVMLEMNVPHDKLEAVIRVLPCMRAPTVAPLYREEGFAVKAAVKREQTVKLIPLLKKMGATDILEYDFRKVIV